VSARPSDSIAIALHADVPIHATEGVLADAGVVVEDDEAEETPASGAATDEDEVDRFRAFLDNISPEDFGRSG
jgi:bifunctional DNase/RNase